MVLQGFLRIEIIVEHLTGIGDGELDILEVRENHHGTRGAHMRKQRARRDDGFALHLPPPGILPTDGDKAVAVLRLRQQPLVHGAGGSIVRQAASGSQPAFAIGGTHKERTVVVAHKQNPVGGGVVMEILVTIQKNGEPRAVRLNDLHGKGESLHPKGIYRREAANNQ